jgi:dienelactone hydrolase
MWRWRRAGWLAALFALALLGLLAWRFGSAAGLALALASPAMEPWVGAFHDRPERVEVAIPTDSGQLGADLYRPARPRGSLLLVHGLSRAGRRQPDLERLARLLAGHGLAVVVPQVDGLAAFRLTGRETGEIRSALRYTVALSAPLPGGSAGVAGFSFGAGPAIIAAADVPGLSVVGSFGGYADLRHVIAYVTTGAHAWQGRHYRQRQEEYNRWKLLALLVPLVAPPGDRERLDEVARRKLADPGADTSAVERELGADGRAVLALVLNRRDDAVDGLLAELPPGARAALERLSPLPAIPRLRARLVVAHGLADDSIPFTESLRLAAAAGDRAHLALFETFHHTGPQPLWSSLGPRARDGCKLLRVVDELLPR